MCAPAPRARPQDVNCAVQLGVLHPTRMPLPLWWQDVNCAFQWAQRPDTIYLNVKFSSRIDGPVRSRS